MPIRKLYMKISQIIVEPSGIICSDLPVSLWHLW